MRLFYTDVFVLPLPPGHRFPMEKYARLRQALLAGGDFSASDFHLPPAASDADYLHRVCCGQLDEKAHERDRQVLGRCRTGGYARDIDDTVAIHGASIALAHAMWR